MSKLFVLHGADSKVGVSMVTQSLAEATATRLPDRKILMVNLQGRYGASYTDYVGESVEGLRHYLDNRILNKEDLLAGCRYRQNFYIIGGVSSIGDERCYQPDMSNYLLSELMEEFDLILADSGSELDNGLALGALVMADEIWMVLTQQESALSRYEKLKHLYYQLQLKFSRVLCNRFEPEEAHTEQYLAKRLELEPSILRTIRNSENGWRAEAEAKTLLAYRGRQYRADIDRLVGEILSLAGLETGEETKKKRWTSFI